MKKLLKHVQLKGIIEVVTGLRIGAGGSSLDIGGLDNPILRHPRTRQPYIPGSSIKGKLRSLLEVNKFRVGNFSEPRATRGPCRCGGCVVCWLFGCADVGNSEPTRLIFRDSTLTPQSQEEYEPLLDEGIFYSEVKAEVTMDRASGKAGKAGPRSMDRIPAGAKLTFDVTARVLDGDNENEMKQAMQHALRLLEAEGIGGSVSRGYGQVKFDKLTWDGQPFDIQPQTAAAQ